jgi:hypothetical protein
VKKPPGLLQTINNEWLRRIDAAHKARQPWERTAELCTNFYQGSVDFMWGDDFRRKYFSNIPSPKFKITISKAFEFVALVGPTVFWDYAQRVVRPFQNIDIQPEAFEGNDQLFQEVMASYMAEKNKNKTRCSILEAYLNYAQQEQPNGGLVADSQLAVTDALITGRGCLWSYAYSFPGSDRVLTGSFFDKSTNLFIDPDSKTPNFSDAQWIARRHCEPRELVERRFGYKPGTLRTYASHYSETDGVTNEDDRLTLLRMGGRTEDYIVWFEVFSKCGVGTRGKLQGHALHDAFEEEIGDYAYICVAKGMQHPLNMTEKLLLKDETEVKKALDWPCPYYKDGRWPVSALDFYPSTKGPWPIAPISPGLGELIFLNVIMSCLAGRVWENSRNIKAILKQAGEDAIRELRSNQYDVTLEFNEQVTSNIQEVVSYLQTPSVNGDVFAIIDRISLMFDKRVGLPDFMYGMNQGGKITRVAADVNAKQQAVSVRPEYMSRCVEKWQAEIANNERICAGWNVRGKDVKELFGETVASLWDTLVVEDPEVFVRNMRCTVVANSTTRPDKQEQFDKLIQLAQYLGPTLQAAAQQSGDYTQWNAFVLELGSVLGIDASNWQIPSAAPPPPQPQEAPVPMEQSMEQELDPMAAMDAMMPQQAMGAMMPQQAMPDMQQMQYPDISGQNPAMPPDQILGAM